MNLRASMGLLVFAFVGSAYAGRTLTIRDLARSLGEASEGRIQPNADEFAKCDRSGDDACEAWTEKRGGGADYVDTKRPLPEDVLRRLFTFRWDPAREGGISFLEHQETRFRNYGLARDRRYLFPFPRVKGWTGLDHPPIRAISQPLSDFHPLLGGPLPGGDHPYYHADFQRALDAMSGTELTAGNRVDLLKNRDSYLRKLDLIRRAKRRLWVTNMVFYCDASSTALADAMAERAAAGVDVRLIIEGLYAATVMKGCLEAIRAKGIDVLPLVESEHPATLTRITHSKFWVRDGEEAIVGGQNILDDENLSDGMDDGYRDTDAWIHAGPAVTDLDSRFAGIWTRNRKGDDPAMAEAIREIGIKLQSERTGGLRGEAVLSRLGDPSKRSQGLCRMLSQEPNGKAYSIAAVLKSLLDQVRDLAIVTTPRMKYDPAKKPESTRVGPIYAAIVAAAERGARIDVVTNGPEGMGGATTSKFRALAAVARSHGRTAIERFWLDFADDLGRATSSGSFRAAEALNRQGANIHAWNYFRYAHQKIHFLDRRMVGVGSFNLDGHSANGNRETELFCMDDSLIGQAETMLTIDLANSTPIRK